MVPVQAVHSSVKAVNGQKHLIENKKIFTFAKGQDFYISLE